MKQKVKDIDLSALNKMSKKRLRMSFYTLTEFVKIGKIRMSHLNDQLNCNISEFMPDKLVNNLFTLSQCKEILGLLDIAKKTKSFLKEDIKLLRLTRGEMTRRYLEKEDEYYNKEVLSEWLKKEIKEHLISLDKGE